MSEIRGPSQDTDIMLQLTYTDSMTAYAISQATGISVPQVNFRLIKMIENGVVSLNEFNLPKKTYSIHPALRSKAAIEGIGQNLMEILQIIDEIEPTTIPGMETIIRFITDRLKIQPSSEMY